MRVCEKCGGLRATEPGGEFFAGTPCICIAGDSALELAGKERLTRPAVQIQSDARHGMVPASELKATIELLTRICTHVRRKHEEINAYLDIIERGEIKRLKAIVRKAETHQ